MTVQTRQEFLSACLPVELIDGKGHKLEDFALSASSSLSGNSGPDRSRMSVSASGELAGAWIAGYNDLNQYIQVLFFVFLTYTV